MRDVIEPLPVPLWVALTVMVFFALILTVLIFEAAGVFAGGPDRGGGLVALSREGGSSRGGGTEALMRAAAEVQRRIRSMPVLQPLPVNQPISSV